MTKYSNLRNTNERDFFKLCSRKIPLISKEARIISRLCMRISPKIKLTAIKLKPIIFSLLIDFFSEMKQHKNKRNKHKEGKRICFLNEVYIEKMP